MMECGKAPCLYGRVDLIHLTWSLTVLIFRSISPTCSFLAVVLMSSVSSNLGFRHSNSPSMWAAWQIKPARLYNLTISLSPLHSSPAVRRGIYWIVTNRTRRDNEIRNGSPPTNMTSATNVMYLFSSMISRGTLTYSGSARRGFSRTDLPLSCGREGPKITFALVILSVIIGQS